MSKIIECADCMEKMVVEDDLLITACRKCGGVVADKIEVENVVREAIKAAVSKLEDPR